MKKKARNWDVCIFLKCAELSILIKSSNSDFQGYSITKFFFLECAACYHWRGGEKNHLCAGECKCRKRSWTVPGWFWLNEQASISRRWQCPSTNVVSEVHSLKGCSSPDLYERCFLKHKANLNLSRLIFFAFIWHCVIKLLYWLSFSLQIWISIHYSFIINI